MNIDQSLTGRRWVLRNADDRLALGIAQRLGLPEIVGRLLAARLVDIDRAHHFLEPTLRALLPDPSVLAGMDAAADRLAHAVRAGETVGVFGDYDVDGACSAAIITLLLRGLGCRVLTHVPDRMREGYGPNAPALIGLVAQGATLIVCVDCGTTAGPVLAGIAGADIVVLDHHATDGPPPVVLATVNPNRLDCPSGLGACCAAAITFMAAIATVRALRRAGYFATRPEPDLRELLDLVALATVCDVMPLQGLNRALVTQGLRVMARRARPGLAALLDAAGARDLPTAMTCGFALGPRINAAGRIGDAGLGLRLLLTDDPVEARALALRLDSTNRDRQDVEAGMLDEALAQAEAQSKAGRAVILVASAGWHAGVVGIVAGRIKERLNRPACVAAIGGDGLAKGSGRSVPGVDLGAAVMAAQQHGLLTAGGGHAMAAGFSLAATGLGPFHDFLDASLAHAAGLPPAADLAVEGSLSVGGATIELAQHLNRLSPFGNGNEEPAFVLPRSTVARAERIGREGTTIRAWIVGEGGGPRLKAMLFRAGEGPVAQALLAGGPALHLAGHLRAEEWNGTIAACFTIADAAAA